MATVTYINNDYEVLAEAMQQLVTMGYFDSVEYDSENDAVVCYDENENAVLTLTRNSSYTSNTNISFRLDDGTVKTYDFDWSGSNSHTGGTIDYIYICSGGAYLKGGNSNSTATSYSFLVISKTNNDKIGIVFPDGGAYTALADRPKVRSWATDDDSVQANTAYTIATPTTQNQETLFNIPTSAAVNSAPSYFSNVYAEFTTMYPYTNNIATPPRNVEQDGKTYLWVGYYMIADEEE